MNDAGDPRTVMRGARSDEAEFLSALAFRSKASRGYDDRFMAACRGELTVDPAAIAEGRVRVLADADRVLGFHGLADAGAGDVELAWLFVEPGLLRRGHGRRLLADAIERARAAGCRRLLIQGDPHAEAFYLAAGAVRIGQRPSDSIPGRDLPLFAIELADTKSGPVEGE